MRCYLTPNGRFVATQAEAGREGKRADVPDDKPGLLAFLNKLVDEVTAIAEGLAIERGMPASIKPEDTITVFAGQLPSLVSDDPQIWRRVKFIPAPAPHAPAISLTDAETFIQAADHRQLTSLFENIVFRARELVRDGGR